MNTHSGVHVVGRFSPYGLGRIIEISENKFNRRWGVLRLHHCIKSGD